MAGKFRRRWYQFGIFSLLVVTTVVALFVALVVVPAKRQRDAVAEILDLGGQVSYDYETAGRKEPPGSAWLRKRIGNDYFQTATTVGLVSKEFEDPEKIAAALTQIARLPSIAGLGIDAAGLQAAHVRQIAQLRSITRLALFRNVTDDCLAELAPMSQLKELNVEGPFTDAGLASLAALKKLQKLHADGQVTGAGAAALVHLEHLSVLGLDGPITDSNLPQVAKLTQLQSLWLGGLITDKGMTNLSPLCKLEHFTCRIGPQMPRVLDELTTFEFEDAPLRDVFDYFTFKHGFTYRFDDCLISGARPPLEEDPVTDTGTNVVMRDAIQRILDPIGLGFRVEDDQLVITTREAAERAHAGINKLQNALPNLRDVKVGW